MDTDTPVLARPAFVSVGMACHSSPFLPVLHKTAAPGRGRGGGGGGTAAAGMAGPGVCQFRA